MTIIAARGLSRTASRRVIFGDVVSSQASESCMRTTESPSVASLIVCLCALMLAPPVRAQNATMSSAEVSDRYVKREVSVRMRDGTHLFTAIYSPRDTTRRYPILLMRTPYGVAPYGAEGGERGDTGRTRRARDAVSRQGAGGARCECFGAAR